MTTVLGSNVLVNLFLGLSLKKLWNLINVIQFLIYFNQWLLPFPANALIFLNSFEQVANGEFIPTDDIKKRLEEKLRDKSKTW